ncbi:MAG: class I SAM-dependent methyltransferase [Propionibacteriaceae bacterium]
MVEPSAWTRTIAADPQHSHRYAARWRRMAAEGHDLDGEARVLDAMAARGSRILDAGCGTGRVGGRLAELGHTVVGADVDPALIDYAKADFPGADWYVSDLALLDLPAAGVAEPFDLVFAAGNVMGFLAPSTRVDVLRRLNDHLAPQGRLVVGFGAGRGYAFEDFFADLATAGLTLALALSTWELHPFATDSGFLVAIASKS